MAVKTNLATLLFGDDGVCRWRYTVPAGTTATVRLPDGKTFEARPGTTSIELVRN